ncbi:MAG: hypothetical protein R6U50_17705 [Desulfobacterales bacterium]
MTTIMPEGEAIRNAVKWISEQRTRHPDIPVHKLVGDAGLRFNLSPKEQEFLARFCKGESRSQEEP